MPDHYNEERELQRALQDSKRLAEIEEHEKRKRSLLAFLAFAHELIVISLSLSLSPLYSDDELRLALEISKRESSQSPPDLSAASSSK